MQNISQQIFKQIQETILLTEGTVMFEYQSPDLFDINKPGGVILEVPSGQRLIRLERDNDLLLHFYHSSPGTGTRVATIDMKQLPATPKVVIFLVWSLKEINLHFGSREPVTKLVTATGVASMKKFRIDKDGHVCQLGDQGVEVIGVRVYKAGQPTIQPTAIDVWKETMLAIDTLATGESAKGYIYETVVTNLTLVMLVTGFEAYTKMRFIELEEEGIVPDTSSVIEVFYPRKERDADIKDLLEVEAAEDNVSTLHYIVGRRVINFQSFKKCKLAYNKVYGIKFGEIGLSDIKIEDLYSYFRYRHSIVHVSPLGGLLNQESVPPEAPVFPNKETAEKAKECFEKFIEALHQATLELRPNT